MIIKTIKQIISLLHPIKRDHVITYSSQVREKTERHIEDMIADINGCSDSWFLAAKSALDECVKKDEDLK